MEVLTIKETVKKTGLSRVTLWRREKEGNFPSRIQLSGKRVGWISSEVDNWIQTRPRKT